MAGSISARARRATRRDAVRRGGPWRRRVRRATIAAPMDAAAPSPSPVPDGDAARVDAGLARFRWFASLAFSFAWVPVMFTAFTRDRGFTGGQYASLWAAYYLAMVVAELPWGWIADRFGYRRLLVAGPFVLAASFVVLGRSSSFELCRLAMMATGAGHAMISGADSSYLYELLRGVGREGEALAAETGAHRWRLFGVSIADLVGGFAAWAFGTTAAFDVSAAAMVVTGLIAWSLPPERGHLSTHTPPNLRAAVAALRVDGVAWVFGWYAAVFVLLRVGFQLYQPTLLAEDVSDLRLHGGLLSVLNLVAAFSAFAVMRTHARIGERGTAFAVLALLGASFAGLARFGAGFDSVGSTFLVISLLCAWQQIAFGFLQPIGRTALNQRIPSSERASLLSAQSVVARLVFAGVMAFGPWDAMFEESLGDAYVSLAVASFVLAVVFFVTHRPLGGSRPRAA